MMPFTYRTELVYKMFGKVLYANVEYDADDVVEFLKHRYANLSAIENKAICSIFDQLLIDDRLCEDTYAGDEEFKDYLMRKYYKKALYELENIGGSVSVLTFKMEDRD